MRQLMPIALLDGGENSAVPHLDPIEDVNARKQDCSAFRKTRKGGNGGASIPRVLQTCRRPWLERARACGIVEYTMNLRGWVSKDFCT